MAGGAVVAITIRGIDDFSNTFDKASSGMNALSSAFKIGAAAVAATGVAVAAFGASAIKAAMDQETAQNRLTQILRTSRDATDEQINSLLQQAKALELVGVVSEENIITTQSQLATFDLEAASIQALTPSILDYVVAEKGASASTEDFRQMTNGLAQALNGNFASLTRTGFVLDEATKELIKTGTEEERIAALTQVLNSTYKDFNETARGTAAGGLQALNNQFQAIKGELGTQLLPVLVDLTTLFSKEILPAIQPLIPLIGDFLTSAIEKLLPYLPKLIDRFMVFIEFCLDLFDALEPLIEPLMELAFVLFDALLEILIPLLPTIKSVADILGRLLTAFMPLIQPISNIIGLIADLAIILIEQLAKQIEFFMPFIEWWVDGFTKIINVISLVVGWIKDLIGWLSKISFGIFDTGAKSIDKTTKAIDNYSSSINQNPFTSSTNQNPFTSSTNQQPTFTLPMIDISPNVIRLNDFIMHPNGKIIQPHSNDTIMGFKGSSPIGGEQLTIIIEGNNIYGTDPDDIADALAKKLNSMIRI